MSGDPDSNPNDDLRVGTPERERAIELLNGSFASGYLEIDEFEERSTEVHMARTRRELRESLRELPTQAQLFPDEVLAAAPIAAQPRAGKPLKLDADWDTKRRKGKWKVPAEIIATVQMGTVDLDFTLADFTVPVVELAVQGSVSTVKLKLGRDHEVRYDDLALTGWSSVKDKAGEPRRPGGPVIILTGHLGAASSVVIKRP